MVASLKATVGSGSPASGQAAVELAEFPGHHFASPCIRARCPSQVHLARFGAPNKAFIQDGHVAA